MTGKIAIMSKVKQILLNYHKGISQREISKRVGVNRKTVKRYILLAQSLSEELSLLIEKPDLELESLVLGHTPSMVNETLQQDLFEYLDKSSSALKKTGVTKFLLWKEYSSQRSDYYSYSHFCRYFQDYQRKHNYSMHLCHKPGQELYIDFTGRKFSYIDPISLELVELEVLIASMGYSGYSYVEAIRSQKVEDYLPALSNALYYFGGIPQVIIPDNFKGAVIKSGKYDSVLNDNFYSFLNHYNTTADPARVRKPQDKAIVERTVTLVYNRIYGPLRDRVFTSLDEVNKAFRIQLEELNTAKFQKLDCSRHDLFTEEEFPNLSPLPKIAFEIFKTKRAKVDKQYHIYLSEDKHHYSVPHIYIGNQVRITITSRQIEISYNGKSIATHSRNRQVNGYSTKKQHMPPTHLYTANWSISKELQWAEAISPAVKEFVSNTFKVGDRVDRNMQKSKYIRHLYKRYGEEKIIKAVVRAIRFKSYDLKVLETILEKKLYELAIEESKDIPAHSNCRGGDAICKIAE